jgi:hypothetical protein
MVRTVFFIYIKPRDDGVSAVDTMTRQGPLLDQLIQARQNLTGRLAELYGRNYYHDIFEAPILLLGLFKSPQQLLNTNTASTATGRNRIIRKVQIKLLQGQLAHPDNDNVKFPWVTTGNGQASGAGNFFRESYTSILQEALQPVFASVGIQFQTCNHAISAMSSEMNMPCVYSFSLECFEL